MKTVLFVAIGFMIILGVFYMIRTNQSSPLDTVDETAALTEEEKEKNVRLTDEGVKYLVDPEKIVGGGPPKDGIPSIDDPKFVSTKEADKWIEDNELVLALNYKGEKRVYPLQIMVWHEIVNDTVAGDPLIITYCPLCGTGIAYERTLNGEAVEFGTSGKLYNSNLVMYDRKTDTYWSQIDGNAIVGELAGQELQAISIDTVVWRDWRAVHNDAIVLSKETGHIRNYGNDPYGSYYEDSFLFFPVDAEDDRVSAKTVVYGIEIDGRYKAYRASDISELKEFQDEFAGVALKISEDRAGSVMFVDVQNEEKVVKERGFWFSWYAFHPDTDLYTP